MALNPQPRSLTFGRYGQFVREAHRRYEDSVLNPHKPPPGAPKKAVASAKEYDRFLREENAARRRRWKRSSRQTLAMVLVCALLPILIMVLNELFF